MATSPKSPFVLIPEALSLLTCEQLVDAASFDNYTIDPLTRAPRAVLAQGGTPFDEAIEQLWADIHCDVAAYYGVTFQQLGDVTYEWYPTGYTRGAASIDGFTLLNGTWNRTSPTDFVMVIALCEYNNQPPFDSDFEVYGGKLEFPSFQFGFHLKMGTAYVFPAAPNFAHGISTVHLGDVFLAKVPIYCTERYLYNPLNFPGNHTS